MNNVKVFVLMAGLTALVVAIGQSLGGGAGAIPPMIGWAAGSGSITWAAAPARASPCSCPPR